MSVGETGFVGEEDGGLIEKDVMERLVWIEISARGDENSDGEPRGEDSERKGIEVIEQPAFERFERTDLARAFFRFVPRRPAFICPRSLFPRGVRPRRKFRNSGELRRMNRRGHDHELVGKQSFPAARERVMRFMERREEFAPGKRKHELHGQRRGDRLQNLAGNFAHQLFQTSQREKTKMSPVENAAIHVVEFSEEQAEANDPVRDIGHGNDDLARFFQRGNAPSQYGRWIAQMLQNIREHDVIEFPPVGKFETFRYPRLETSHSIRRAFSAAAGSNSIPAT